jgi:hypothetical protein
VGRGTRRRLTTTVLCAAVLLLTTSTPFAGAPGRSPLSAAPGVPDCRGADALDFGCYQRRYRAMTATRGANAAIRDLNARSTRLGYLRAACHQLMHGIGRDTGRRLGIRAFAQGDESCSSGFYHGVVEAVMTRTGAARVERDPSGVCAPFRDRESHGMAHYNCVHGMGHGFMDVYAGDVFRSLEGCGELPDSWERHHCEGGVFMENLTAMTKQRHPPGHLRPEQSLYPCTAVAARYKHECYMKQTAYALFVRDYDFGAVFAMCAASPDVRFRPDCYQGLGGDASIQASKYVTGAAAVRRATLALCRLGHDRAARRNCVVGAVTVIVRDGASRNADPVAFCGSLREPGLRAACSGAHLKTVQDLTSNRGARRAAADPGGHDSPTVMCKFADRLETASTRAPLQQDERRDVR